MAMPRVLLVDDEPMLLRSLRRVLSRQYDISMALSAEEAIGLIEQNPAFDAIVSDRIMPGMSGEEFYRALGERWPALARRFVLLSGGSLQSLEGIDVRIVHKGASLDDLLAVLREIAGP